MTTWFITGTSSGFGLGLVQQLLARGDRVAATLRRPQELAALKAQYGDALWIATLDVTDGAAVGRVVDDAFAALGRIDVVVSNAGYGLFGAGEEVTDAQIRHLLDTNLIGSMQVIRAVLPHLRAQGGGRILQLSSEGGQIAYPNFSLYHASKWAIEGFVESVAQEVAGFGIALTLIEPGPTGTDFAKGLVVAAPIAAYADTPAGAMRRALLSGGGDSEGGITINGDPDKMVQAMIACAQVSPAPRRLLLGSGAYQRVRAALTARLAELDAQQRISCAMDMEA
jgi:NAD(P)-dependent dehydrogenase (short-subunit alcohol dehydrogenase family)